MQEPGVCPADRTGGQYQVASWLRSFGYTVKVIDFCFSIPISKLEEIARKHIDKTTIAFGVSTTFWNVVKIKIAGKLIGDVEYPEWVSHLRSVFMNEFPSIKWIVGGSNSLTPILENDWIRINYFAEDETLAFLDKATNNFNIRPKFNIQNFVKFYSNDDYIESFETLSIEISRGCIFKCKFCQFPLIGRKKGTNIRAEADIYNELMYNYNQFGTTKYYFSDDTFNESLEKVQMIHRISLSLPFELEYIAYLRLDLIATYPEMITLLPESGLRSAFFGIESFQLDGVKAIGKGWNGHHAKSFLLHLKKQWKGKTNWLCSIILGLPNWSEEQEERDVQWLVENEMSCWTHRALYINPANVIQGKKWVSEFEKEYEKYGYRFADNDFINWTNGELTHTQLQQIAKKIEIKTRNYRKVAGFKIGEISKTLQCTMKELIDVNECDIDHDILYANTKEFIETYIKKNLE